MTKRIITAFAASGDKNTVPDTAPGTDNGFANYPNGFPPSNSIDPALGGYYVKRSDFNGVLNDVTSILRDQAQGLFYTYDLTYATAISGYPVNAILAKVGAIGFWLNITAGNTANPDTGGAGWVDFSPKAIQNNSYSYAEAGGSTTTYTATLTPAPSALTNGMIVFVDTGTVGANTTTTPTLNLNGLGAKTQTLQGGAALIVGCIPKFALYQYDSAASGTWVLLNPDLSSQFVPRGTIFPYTGSSTVAPAGYIFDGSVLSRSTYPELFDLWVTSQGFTSQAFTVTIASPAVFTKSTHGFTNGERLRLSTTGALPTGLNTTTDYFVEIIDANTFYLTTSKFGVATRINTSGTQSGTHSYMQSLYGLGDGSTTFNAPDTRGMFIQGLPASGRKIGTYRKGTLEVVDTLNAGASNGVWSISADLSGTDLSVSTAQKMTGLDSFSTSDYPNLYNMGATGSGAVALPGSGGGEGASGVIRPNNIAFPYIIKY